jgi:hypothetical protein
VGIEEAIEETEKRIRRLQAEIELLEEELERLESGPSKYSPKLGRESAYYMIFIGVWIVIGILALIYVKSRLPANVSVPLGPYLIVGIIVVFAPIIYLMWEKRSASKNDPKAEIESKIRDRNLVLSLFYEPLKKALEDNDTEALRELADRLLDDPILASAVLNSHEGEPKMMAYALYLYATGEGSSDEVGELLQTLSNKPLRALLNGP